MLRRIDIQRNQIICSEVKEAGKVDGSSIVADGETAKKLEAAEASLDPIALLVEFAVVRD